MKLDSERLHIRPFEPSDGSIIHKWFYSGDYEKYFRYHQQVLKRSDFESSETLLGGSLFMLSDKTAHLSIGMVGVHGVNLHSGTCKISALIDKEHEANGYAKEGMIAVGRYLFEDLGFERLNSDPLEIDERTCSILTEAGFEKAGQVDVCKLHGKIYNEVRYYMNKSTFLLRYKCHHS